MKKRARGEPKRRRRECDAEKKNERKTRRMRRRD